MKLRLAFILFGSFLSSLLWAQYYMRGEVKDEHGRTLQNVNIYQYSTQLLFRSGGTGEFGITSKVLYDSLLFYLDGFEPVSVKVKTSDWISIRMKSFAVASSTQKIRMLSLTKDLPRETKRSWFYNDESYETLIENNFVPASKYPQTNLVLNVDKASYSNIRRILNNNEMVPPDAVRIEEMLNYFSFNYDAPKAGNTFKLNSSIATCPWNKDNKLLYLHVSAAKLNIDTIPPSNLVFLIDVSGSMDLPNKLPLLQSAFKLLVNNLRAEDTVSIVVYGGSVAVKLYPTSGAEKEKIIEAIDDLSASGSTPGENALRTAYDIAKRSFIPHGNNRVILATDGDFNVGITKEHELENFITAMRQSGVFLTCLGVGMGNYKDSKLYVMAKKGNGNLAYLDNLAEAEKVLVQEFFQTIYAVAEDVTMAVKFNDYLVSEYRLIGFDNKKSLDEKFITTDELEGGEIGSGHSVLAVFEIKLRQKNSAATHTALLTDDVMACVDINFRRPTDTLKRVESFSVEVNEVGSDHKYDFATCVLMMGSLLRHSPFTAELSWQQLLTSAKACVDPGNKLQKEFLQLVQKATVIYKDSKKKKKLVTN
jgi:Ca-activated chloride channel family protein